MKYLLLFSLFLVVHKGCGDKPLANEATSIQVGERVTLAVGEMLRVKGSEKAGFRFTSVENDNRCPTGLSCFQAGSATLLLEALDSPPKQLNIPADDGGNGTNLTYGGAKVKIISVDPYPSKEQPKIPADKYSITLELLATSN